MDAIGALAHRMTFQAPSGSSADGYSDVLTRIPAQVEMLSGSEALRYGAQSSSQLVKVTVRYLSGVLPEWRMVDEDGVAYQILHSGDPTGGREWRQIFAVGVQ